jgi:hypothetical protein
MQDSRDLARRRLSPPAPTTICQWENVKYDTGQHECAPKKQQRQKPRFGVVIACDYRHIDDEAD